MASVKTPKMPESGTPPSVEHATSKPTAGEQ